MFGVLGILCVLALVLPAGASAAVVTGTGADPAGDQTGGGASADIVSLRASYDDAGSISGELTVSAPLPASSGTFAFVFFGVRQADGSCRAAVGVGDTIGAAGSRPMWGTPAEPERGPAARAVPGAATLALSATSAELAGLALDCAYGATAAGGAGDRTAPVTLQAAQAPAPQPTSPQPSQPKPRPARPRPAKPKPRSPKPKPLKRRAALVLSITAPRSLAAGRSLRLRVVVANRGRAVARRVQLRVSARGLSVARAARTIGSLRPGARRAVTIRVTRRGRGVAAVRVRVTGARRLSATRTIAFALPAPPTRPGAPTRPDAPSDGLEGLAFLRLESGTPGISQDTRVGYVFTSRQWVYRGTPENGMPSCTSRTAGAEEDAEGCLPYSYDARSGGLTIDGRPATLNASKTELTVGEDTFLLKQGFAPGERLSVSLKNIEVYGLWPNQSVFTSWLTLTADGQFAFSGSAIGSVGSGDPSTISSTIAPDRRGTYAILPGSTIEFRYADGRVGRRMILVNGTPEGAAKLDPQREGLLLDGTAYWS